MTQATRWLSRREAAEYTRLSYGYLANLASRGLGPKFYSPITGGNAKYDIADLDAWLSTRKNDQ